MAHPFITLAAALMLSEPAAADDLRQIDGQPVSVTQMASKLRLPWGLAFLPGCEFLVTEKRGRLLRFDLEGHRSRVAGLPKVKTGGQGGLLDIETARDFNTSRQLFLTYSAAREAGTGTALAVAELSEDGDRLEKLREVFISSPVSNGNRHFGSRVVEAEDGNLFLSVGDRGERSTAQYPGSHNGSILRIRRDGTVPDTNPFTTSPEAKPEIWSIGHRNPQGMTFDNDGRLWISEHGARGGDEINHVLPGLNFGWPVISYGVHYSGRKIGEGFSKEGMEQPAHYWDPSIAPSGMIAYSGALWPQWEGNLFVGSLKFDLISRLELSDRLRETEQIRIPETKRVRDVQEAPDGTIWFISEDRGAVYRISPPSGPPGDSGWCH